MTIPKHIKNTIYCFVLFFLFQNLYSQHSILRYPFFYLPSKQKPTSIKSAIYNLSKEYNGSVVFDDVEYNGNVILRKDSIIVGDVKIYSFNKKLTKLNLANNEENVLIERVGKEMYLQRVLIDTLGVKIYDMKIFKTVQQEKVDVFSLKLGKENEFTKFPNSFLRSRKGKIRTFLKRADLNPEQELFFEKWLNDRI